MNLKELEAVAKELAPIIKASAQSVRDELNKEINRLNTELAEIKSAPVVEPEKIDVDSIAKAAADLVVLPEPAPVDLAAVAKMVEVPQPEKPDQIDVDAIVKKVSASIRQPEDGKSVDREDVIKAVSAEFERRFSDLMLHCERKAAETFEKALDRMPKPKDGADALPLESFDIAMAEDGRTLTVKMQAGERVLEKSLRIPAMLDRGSYSSEKNYEAGDVVSHGGSMWIAGESVEGAPGLGGNGWRLAVKKGRDGKDLRDNSASVDVSKGVKI